jgi:hypothetical protein
MRWDLRLHRHNISTGDPRSIDEILRQGARPTLDLRDLIRVDEEQGRYFLRIRSVYDDGRAKAPKVVRSKQVNERRRLFADDPEA